MIKYYAQWGKLVVCTKAEFLATVPREEYIDTVVYPYVVAPPSFVTSMEVLSPSMEIVKYEPRLDLQFFSNKHFPEHDINDVIIEMAQNYAGIEEIYAVLIGKNFYIYSHPKILTSNGNYQVISRNYKDVYSCSVEHSGIIKGVNIVKATRLAKKMYPEAEEVNGMLYLLGDC